MTIGLGPSTHVQATAAP